MFTSKFKYVNILAEAKPRLAQSLVHMQVFIFFLNESSPLEINFGLVELKKKFKNFCPLFKKILALKVIMHMCMKVKDRVKSSNVRVKKSIN